MVLLPEAVRPVSSPGYATTRAEVLNGPVGGWRNNVFLEIVQTNRLWASCEGWLEVAGRPEFAPRYVSFDSYSYLLEAAIAGHGVALG